MSYLSPTAEEIEQAVYAIVSVMPPARGMDGTKLVQGYTVALKSFPISSIRAAVEGFLNGRFAADFSTKFCPTPPDLAAMVRKVNETAAARQEGLPPRRKYAFNAPASKFAERNIRRDDARRLVEQGMYPKGCIWVPGPAEREEYGDLHYPDPEWRPPVLIRTPEEQQADETAPEPKELGMTPDEKRMAVDRLGTLFRTTPPRERGGFWARDHSAVVRRWILDERQRAQASVH